MKTKIRNLKNSCYQLVIDQPGVKDDEKPVLASANHYFSSGSWSIEDVRLTEHHKPSKWFCISADKYHAHFDAKTEDEAKIVRSILTTFKEEPKKNGVVQFDWCTFEGLVPGRTAQEISKEGSIIPNSYPLFHTRKDALSLLNEMVDFWDKIDLDAADPEIIEKAGSVKVENYSRQPNDMQVLIRVMVAAEKDQKSNKRTKKP